MNERFVDVNEIEKFVKKLAGVQEDISKNYQSYNDALQMLFDEGIIQGKVETKLTDAYYEMVNAKDKFEEKMEEFILYAKNDVIDEAQRTEDKVAYQIKEKIEQLEEGV